MVRPLQRKLSQRLAGSSKRLFSSLPPTRQSFQIQTSSFRWPIRRTYATGSGPRSRPGQSPFKVWPFVAITLVGTGAYILMVRNRAETMAPAIDAPKDSGKLPVPTKETPTFSADKVTVVFVLGGPGAGKGTQCENLVRDYHFTHLSAGDLLRAEQDRPGSEFGGLIKDCIKNGAIVPMEVTVQLLENAMTETLHKHKSETGRFLIDGFPRKMDQALKFEEAVCPARLVLFFDVPEDVMQERLLKRGKTSGRADDNEESIKKRFKTFVETSMPVVEYYEKQGRVLNVKATSGPDEVYRITQKGLKEKLGNDL